MHSEERGADKLESENEARTKLRLLRSVVFESRREANVRLKIYRTREEQYILYSAAILNRAQKSGSS